MAAINLSLAFHQFDKEGEGEGEVERALLETTFKKITILVNLVKTFLLAIFQCTHFPRFFFKCYCSIYGEKTLQAIIEDKEDKKRDKVAFIQEHRGLGQHSSSYRCSCSDSEALPTLIL